jgi:2-polyprenyl-3-methyl-5-hydroxy-6-metoxy-1,4-benzoquinol methylase
MPEAFPELKYDYDFDPSEENSTAAAIFNLLDKAGSRILDLGSGPAIVSSRFAKRSGYRVICADMDTVALAAAARAGVDETHEIDLDADDWFAELPREQFDSIVLADVLEHLRQPQKLLDAIISQGFLAQGGRLIISVPNASHVAVIGSLLAGDFAYTESGILDETHVRWFTLTSLTRMLEEQGFRVDSIHRTLRSIEQTQQSPYQLNLTGASRQALAELGVEGQTLQYVLSVSYRASAAETEVSQAMIDQIRKEFDLASKQLVVDLQERTASAEKAAEEFRSLNSLHETELDSLRTLIERERALALHEFESLTAELAARQRNARQLRRQVNEVTSSRSWKVARILSAAAHPASSIRKLRQRRSRGKKS